MASNQQTTSEKATIVLAGITGDLGGRIAQSLLAHGANVRAITRPGTTVDTINKLKQQGVSIIEADYKSVSALSKALSGATCVVSALSGLQEVILEAQRVLLYAAVEAGVPRFIPSDYSIDFTNLPRGTNRNLDLRQEFSERLDAAPIAATSVLNGMFTDLLTGQAPLVLFPLKRIVYWGDADQPLDFTTISDTAAFTAAAAMDSSTPTPRYLRVAGDTLSARELREVASASTGKEFQLFRIGGLGTLDLMIKFTRAIMPQSNEVFPPWQGMQYLRNMFSGKAKLEHLDNDRYPDISWTPVSEVLAAYKQ
ncbi:NmrA family NAD(P)-binding protein [Pontibacter rugosus]|uniref:NmrA family NAD(P)-binding protein n=1 Tax=Pontibacter rugosus TaxID=1745966 RepID=A0ABW3SWW5_9BACT